MDSESQSSDRRFFALFTLAILIASAALFFSGYSAIQDGKIAGVRGVQPVFRASSPTAFRVIVAIDFGLGAICLGAGLVLLVRRVR